MASDCACTTRSDADAALGKGRRFAPLTRNPDNVSSETWVDPLDALLPLRRSSPLSSTRTVLRIAAALAGTIVRDAEPLVPLILSEQSPAAIRRGALIAALIFGTDVPIDPGTFGELRADVDALARHRAGALAGGASGYGADRAR